MEQQEKSLHFLFQILMNELTRDGTSPAAAAAAADEWVKREVLPELA